MSRRLTQLEPISTNVDPKNMTTAELKSHLKEKGLSVTGNKETLIERYLTSNMAQIKSAPSKSVSFARGTKEEDLPITSYNGKNIDRLKDEELKTLLKKKGFSVDGPRDIWIDRLKKNENLPFSESKASSRQLNSPVPVKMTSSSKSEKKMYTENEIKKLIESKAKINNELFAVKEPNTEADLDNFFRGNLFNALLKIDVYLKGKGLIKSFVDYLNKKDGKFRDSEIAEMLSDFYTDDRNDRFNILKSTSILHD